MGPNDREADAAESKNDFIAKYTIVKKETNETIFWLEVIHDTNSNTLIRDEANKFIVEGTEIYKIIKSIIIKTKSKE